ncbi:unnamed protein product [Pylaiella littoralis]
MAMDVRWRLFARDVLSLRADESSGELCFGRPPRPVRGLRLLGVVVHRAQRPMLTPSSLIPGGRSAAAAAAATVESHVAGNGKTQEREYDGVGFCGGVGGGNGAAEGEFGLVGIDDGTGVVGVRLPLRLWNTVAIWDQLDIVGTPERLLASVLSSSSSSSFPCLVDGGGAVPRLPRPGVSIKADGCYVENDPNVSTLRTLECINLYKACYFSRAWSPSATPLPPLLPDPQRGRGQAGGGGAADAPLVDDDGVGGVAAPDFHGRSSDGGGGRGGRGGGGDRGGGGTGAGAGQKTPSVEDLLGLIGSMGGATGDELKAELGVLSDHAGVASALAQVRFPWSQAACPRRGIMLCIFSAVCGRRTWSSRFVRDQMQLDGAIYLAGDRYMPL